jgi:hypothetical protein
MFPAATIASEFSIIRCQIRGLSSFPAEFVGYAVSALYTGNVREPNPTTAVLAESDDSVCAWRAAFAQQLSQQWVDAAKSPGPRPMFSSFYHGMTARNRVLLALRQEVYTAELGRFGKLQAHDE